MSAIWMGGVIIACLVLLGCGKGGAKLDEHAFDGAAPEVRASWDKAKTADQADDFATAIENYKQLTRQEGQLTAEQVMLLRTEFSKLQKRVLDASREGNQEARRLLDMMRSP